MIDVAPAPEFDMNELLLKRRELELLRRKKEIAKRNGLSLYRPHDKQNKFHCAGAYRRRYARTGNRFGKSTMGTAEDLAWALGERIWYAPGHPARTAGIPHHAVKIAIIVADWDKAEEIFTSQAAGDRRGKIFALCPEQAISSIGKAPGGQINQVMIKSKWGGDSIIYLDTVKSFIQNPMGHESGDWDAVHIDEPCPQDMWVAYARGLTDRRGSAWFTCTPLTEMWINDYFIPKTRTRQAFSQPLENAEDSKWVITGSTFDNPHLERESIEDFVKDVPEHERATRIEGRPRALAGVIHRDFERDVHVYDGPPHGWKDHMTPPKDYTRRFAIDPHPMVPHAVLFAATAPHGVTYFHDEIFAHCLISELCDLIKTVDGWDRAEDVLCDPIAFVEDPRDGSTMASDMMDAEIVPVPASKDLSRGILLVGEILRRRDLEGRPVVQFSHTLGETLFEFDRYVWDTKKQKPHSTCPDHMMENLYRLVVNGLHYVAPTSRVYKTIMPLKTIKASMSIPGQPKAHVSPFTLSKRYPV